MDRIYRGIDRCIDDPKEKERLKVEIIGSYESGDLSVADISDILHVSRSAIYKYLRKHGVDTSKAAPVECVCTACGKVFKKKACLAKKVKNHFCAFDCYMEYIREVGKDYIGSRTGQALSRRKVASVFELKPEHIVHHEDKNCRNTDWPNLRVFANHNDHMSYHRGGDAKPIWDGTELGW